MNNQELHQRVAALAPSQRETLARQLGVSTQRLIAYVVAHAGEVDAPTVRNVLKAKLPHYMVPAAIVSLPELPRTANGKIDIRALPTPQLSAPTTDATAPRTPTEDSLVQIWKAVLGLDTLGIHDNFFELGGDSILSIQIVSRAREAGLRLAPNQLFEQPTVAELAAVVNLAPDIAATQDLVIGNVPLTPIQHWFFEQNMEVPQHWHQARLVEIPNGVSATDINTAIAALYTHHDALRMRFDHGQQINGDASHPPDLIQIDLSHLSDSEQATAVADHGSHHIHGGLDLADGGLMRAVLFTRGTGPRWLLLSIHHLVVDAVSWQILLEDLSNLLKGEPQLPEKTTSFKTWAETLVTQTAARQSEETVWLSQLEQAVIDLPRDYPHATPSTEGTAQTLTVALSKDDTQALLKVVPAAYNTHINDALLTALGQTLLQWVGAAAGSVRLEIETHGREQIADGLDLSRTVGWFTTTYPMGLKIGHCEHPIESLKSVKEQLRQVPDRGIGYGMLRYLGTGELRQQLAKPAEVLFNYLGQQTETAKGLRVIQAMDVGRLRHPHNRRGYLLEINAWVAEGQLQINWRYDPQVHRSETLTMVANQYVSALKTLIASCGADESGGFTPSDFPDVDLDQTELDDFISQLTEGD